MCIITDGSERDLPIRAELLTDNNVSKVYRGHDGYIYKRSTPFLIENELYCYRQMNKNFVPQVGRYDKYTLKIDDLGSSDFVLDGELFRKNMYLLLDALREAGIRHGDLTQYSIIVKKDWPYVIDFAESRLVDDPRPDKRKEGDEFWLERTINELTPTY